MDSLDTLLFQEMQLLPAAKTAYRWSRTRLLNEIEQVMRTVAAWPGVVVHSNRDEVHFVAGESIVGRVPGLEIVADAVRASHERWDGLGYPDGLAGHDIPLAARIVAVADSYAAMTTPDRPYREPLSAEEAEEEVIRCAGTQFDPVVAEAFLAVLASDRAASVAAA